MRRNCRANLVSEMMNKHLILTAMAAFTGLSGCVSTDEQPYLIPVAQKIMLDVRYFCPEGIAEDEKCTQPVTDLPLPLAQLIRDTGIGGVILFAENLQSTEQIVRLNDQLQQQGKVAGHGPLFIAIDQEGGRVMRLPAGVGTAFAGNMALGASESTHGNALAKASANVIGEELRALGFNVNFAPTLDVNVNPDNPVINVRSYGEDPKLVARLGLAQSQGFEQAGVLSALKHFPGHGDTSVDSHIGLPRVEHDRQRIENIDLLPFRYAIEQGNPAMIMTAHIQYPALEPRTFVNKDGKSTELPATLSRAILTDLLRDEMGFKGLIVTDALDMAGISQFFSPVEATIQTFAAGADIALMPYTIRTPQDIRDFKQFLRAVAAAYADKRLSADELTASLARIDTAKSALRFNASAIDAQVTNANQILSRPQSRLLEQNIADAAITMNLNKGVLPLSPALKSLDLLMPDQQKCEAMQVAMARTRPGLEVRCASIANKEKQPTPPAAFADALIVADVFPAQTLAELGGMDDLDNWRQRASKADQWQSIQQWMQRAKTAGKPVVLINLRTPYQTERFNGLVDAVLTSYDYRIRDPHIPEANPSYLALAKVLFGEIQAHGTSPVSWQRAQE